LLRSAISGGTATFGGRVLEQQHMRELSSTTAEAVTGTTGGAGEGKSESMGIVQYLYHDIALKR